MPCAILKLCDYWSFHKEGDVTITIGAQQWEGRLHVALCRRDSKKHHPHLDLMGAEPLLVVEKILRAVRVA